MKNSAKKIKNDIILVCAILILALAAFLVFKACAKEGGTVSITIDGELYKELPLNTDAVVEVVSGENGEYKNTVTIKDGRVSISYANCPDGICEKHRAIKHILTPRLSHQPPSHGDHKGGLNQKPGRNAAAYSRARAESLCQRRAEHKENIRPRAELRQQEQSEKPRQTGQCLHHP